MSELQELIADIKANTKQTSINKVDEIKVMKSMVNDAEFKLDVYDKTLGVVGTRCPHEEAVSFIKNVIQGATGLESKDAEHLAKNYEFTKKDASFLVQNAKDFVEVYMNTGRKLNLIQAKSTEASIYARSIPASTKTIPDRLNGGSPKEVKTSAYTKIVSVSRCPKYNI